MESNLTPRAQQILALARQEALRLDHSYVGTEHLLLGILRLGEGVAVNALEKLGVDLDMVRLTVEKEVGESGTAPESSHDNIPYTSRAKRVVHTLAAREAKALNHSYIGTEHLLLALLAEGDGVAARVLKNLGLELDKVRKAVMTELDPMNRHPGNDTATASTGAGDDTRSSSRASALKAFGRDLTELAKNGSLDPVVGRKNEIRRVIQILARRTKNNPILIGEAGVGKTAIVEGLAQEIASANVPDILLSKRVVVLDLALVVAGTKYRGQFEERMKNIMDEVRRNKNVILFIDEMHTIVGAGAAEGTMDASNIFKPALSRAEMQVIGATTLGEFRKHIEKDTALERRFQSVLVNPASVEDSIAILRGVRIKYEEHHKCEYTDEAIETAVKLSDRYITGRHLPDKAIDVLDEAGARARIEAYKRPPELETFQKQVEAVNARKEKAVAKQDFEGAAKCRDEEQKIRAERDTAIESWRKNRSQESVTVNADVIFKIVSDWTGIPLERMEKKETRKLLELEAELQSAVIGQDRACEVIARALRRSRADLKDPKRPIGSFLFLGPTGVGKTLLVKTLAERVFADAKALVQIDMSEYMEKFTVSRLVGSPPGYIGYEEGGQLTEAVRRKPYSVILLDEVEKAHPDVLQLLLQVLEDGRLTDSLGRTVDFRNTILIMTSNVGADVLQRNNAMGFDVGLDAERDFARVKTKILDETKRVFRPEFLNRLSEIVIFSPLSKENLGLIVDLELAKVSKRLAERDIVLNITPEARAFLLEKGYDEKYGARPLRRAIERFLEDPLAERIIRGDLDKGDHPVTVGVAPKKEDVPDDEGGLTFVQPAPAARRRTATPPSA
ncbi:MAG: ATP-dependent Clp protease ATP-binding subunit [Puniceicoccales bacterium]|jgi:ATP-dependent Clp protease ATP-binding subunit ClpC|nr:ATP-dependent Clp protease ATP-binding subunit [Puniceicoccales bacterium]